MDDDDVEVLDLTQARNDDREPRNASTVKRTVTASEADSSSKNGDTSDAVPKHSMTKLTALRHSAARTTDLASINTFQTQPSDRRPRGRASSPPPVFRRPRILESAAALDHDHEVDQAGFATPSDSRKRSHSTMLTPSNSMRNGDNSIDEGSPLAKKSKRAHIDDTEPTHHGLLADGRKLDARLDDLLGQGGVVSGDTHSPNNDTATVDEGPTASQFITNDERSNTTPRLELSPAQRFELWNPSSQQGRGSAGRPQSQTQDTDEQLSIKTRKCQACGDAKVKQDMRELFATQWQEIFGRDAQTPQQVGVEGQRATAANIEIDGVDVQGRGNDSNIGSNNVGSVGVVAGRDAQLSRLLAINEQLRAGTLELARKHDADSKPSLPAKRLPTPRPSNSTST
ncbi:hypothetical protein EJ03DRAFT_376729 [Teratosphaeria nubilosa]|uniref:Uncharacterized protein n=1 Tax=Teratosphaeria nubilosa TaxID=161662 RepID=A0A6G1L2Z1_9PEZI|nr:hypothetical protein EJ03DRAFT_376729 [Teratosphaeria nubilosa]